MNQKIARVSFTICLGLSLLLLASCDIISSDSSEDGFLAEAGPILYIGNENEPYSEFHKKQLYSINEDGRNNEQLTDYEDHEVVNAQWAPNGDHIVMVRNRVNSMSQWSQNLYLVDQDGKNGETLVTNENDQWGIKSVSTPVWSPDSKEVAFVGLTNVTGQGKGEHDVYVVNIESAEMRKITNSPGILEELMSWSSDGQIYATQIWKNTSPTKNQMMAFNEEGETIKEWQRFQSHYTRPILSHDRQHLAFMKGRYETSDGENADQADHRIMMMALDAEPDSASVLTNGEFRSYKPVAWSPDNEHVLAQGITPNTDRQQQEAPNRYHILKVSREGSGVQEITPEREDYYYEPVSWIAPSKIGTSR